MKMKHYLPMAVVAMALAACSDDYDDTALWNTVNDHGNRIAALEQWQDEVNNNIAALQQLLNTNDMITSVIPVMENGKEVGYTIAFLHSDPITIYHGEKGEKGDKGEQGIQGEQGVQGTPGKDGADGDTPVVGLLKGRMARTGRMVNPVRMASPVRMAKMASPGLLPPPRRSVWAAP